MSKKKKKLIIVLLVMNENFALKRTDTMDLSPQIPRAWHLPTLYSLPPSHGFAFHASTD